MLSGADGAYLFSNLVPGNYQVVQSQPAFLADGLDFTNLAYATRSSNDSFAIALDQNTNATALNFGELGRQASFISIRDLFASTPRQSVLAAVNSSSEIVWSAPGIGWEGYSITGLQRIPSSNQLKVNAVQTGSTQTVTTTLDVSRPDQVQVLGDQNGTQLLRFLGPASQYTFTPVPSQGSGEGEGEATVNLRR